MMNRITGDFHTRKVMMDGTPLDPRISQKLRNHSRDGFAWGYGGSGPAQLALAILERMTSNRDVALRWYQDFKWAVIATLPENNFDLSIDIQAWISEQEAKEGAP